MKKLSKIIALILSVALLCGVVFSFTASADNLVSDIYGQLDLDNPEEGIRSVGIGDAYGHNNASISDWQDAYVDTKGAIKGSITGNVKYYSGRNGQHDIVVNTANGNKYLRYKDTPFPLDCQFGNHIGIADSMVIIHFRTHADTGQ